MDELAREYHETHDPEIPEEIYKLAGQLREMDHRRQIRISPMLIVAWD